MFKPFSDHTDSVEKLDRLISIHTAAYLPLLANISASARMMKPESIAATTRGSRRTERHQMGNVSRDFMGGEGDTPTRPLEEFFTGGGETSPVARSFRVLSEWGLEGIRAESDGDDCSISVRDQRTSMA